MEVFSETEIFGSTGGINAGSTGGINAVAERTVLTLQEDLSGETRGGVSRKPGGLESPATPAASGAQSGSSPAPEADSTFKKPLHFKTVGCIYTFWI